MSAYSLMFVGLRLMAVWFLIIAIQQMFWSIDLFVRMETGNTPFDWFFLGVIFLGVAAGLVLWWVARPLSKLATKALPDDPNPVGPSLIGYYHLALSLLGVWLGR